jgi:hypothetical protein
MDIAQGTLGTNAAIIMEIKARSTNFHKCSFVHECRASNYEAHNLAKYALLLGVECHLWLNTPYSVDCKRHFESIKLGRLSPKEKPT